MFLSSFVIDVVDPKKTDPLQTLFVAKRVGYSLSSRRALLSKSQNIVKKKMHLGALL